MKFEGEGPIFGKETKVDFDWAQKLTAGGPAITIADYGVLINRSAHEMMGKPEHVILGFDEDTRTIGIKIVDLDLRIPDWPKDARVFKTNPSDDGIVRLNCRPFIRNVFQSLRDPRRQTTQVAAEFHPNRKLLTATVSEDSK